MAGNGAEEQRAEQGLAAGCRTRSALVLRTNYFDDDLVALAERYATRAGMPFLVVADVSGGAVEVPAHLGKVALDEAVLAEHGLLVLDGWGWRCGDYFLISAAAALPEVEYFWIVEPDVLFDFDDLGDFFGLFDPADGVDLIAPEFGDAPPGWQWSPSVQAREGQAVKRCLFGLVRASRRLIERVHKARMAERERFPPECWGGAGALSHAAWANDEAIMANTLVENDFVGKSINAFGDVYDRGTFNFDLPVSREKLRRAPVCSRQLLHPVLGGRRYLERVRTMFRKALLAGTDAAAVERRFSAPALLEQVRLEGGIGEVEAFARYKHELLGAAGRRYGFSVVACARWETRFIVEWLNYYRAIGFDHVYLYCNDDDPSELYETVLPFTQGPDPFVTFRYYPVQGAQLQMYQHFLQHDRDVSEWIGFFDIDEYLRLPRGMTISQFTEQMGDVDCVLFNWIFFGPDGHKDEPGISILKEYTRRQQNLHPFTKYVARSGIFAGSNLFDMKKGHGFWHCPIKHIDPEIKSVNSLGEDMSNYYDGFPDQCTAFINQPERRDALLATAVVHHYAFRSEAAFAERARRGLGGAFSGQTMWSDLAAGDKFASFLAGLHEVEDRSLAHFWPNYLSRAQTTNVLGTKRTTKALDDDSSGSRPLSQGKCATQSSVSRWSRFRDPERDAAGALTGDIDGRAKFHTDIEESPWWQVDLGGVFGIREIRLYNRMDQAGVAQRASRLAVEVALEPDRFVEIFRREVDEPFGGVDGNPLVVTPTIPIPGRFVRIRLLRRNYLHLDQVEVYGEPLFSETKETQDGRCEA